jgi:hypothetical protein
MYRYSLLYSVTLQHVLILLSSLISLYHHPVLLHSNAFITKLPGRSHTFGG